MDRDLVYLYDVSQLFCARCVSVYHTGLQRQATKQADKQPNKQILNQLVDRQTGRQTSNSKRVTTVGLNTWRSVIIWMPGILT